MPALAALASAVALGVAGMIVLRLPVLRGTTLAAPAAWKLLALILLATAPWILHLSLGPGWQTFLLFAAATATFCPFMALLGAKRPQDRGWQFIVLSLWLVLLAAAGRQAVLHGGRPLELHPAWLLFCGVLVGIGCLNHLPTRAAAAACSLAAGQILLLGAAVWIPWQPHAEWLTALGVLLCAVAWWPFVHVTQSAGWNGVWRDFRDEFGALWSLRLANRFNAAAQQNSWNQRIAWNGFEPGEAPLSESEDPVKLAEMETSLEGLLRRFVSPEWIARRRRP